MATHPFDTARPGLPGQTDGAGSELARVEADIARTREQVSRSVSALREAVVRRTDWRQWVSRHPGVFLGAAFLLGFVWGRRAPAHVDRRIIRSQSRRRLPWK
jgi:hypothetical protein